MDSRSLPISQRVAEFTVVNRYLLFIVATVITALLSMGILRTSFDTSLSALLSESDPYLDELDLLEQQFPSSSEIRFAFIAEEGETIFTREILEAIRELEDIFTEIPRIRGITTVLEYTAPETQRRLFS